MSERVVVTLSNVNWEGVITKIKQNPYQVKQKRKLDINNLPSGIYSYTDSRLGEHKLLCSSLDIATGKPLESRSKCWWCDDSPVTMGAVIRKKTDSISVFYTQGYYCDKRCA